MSRLFRTSFLKGLLKEQQPRLVIDRQMNLLWPLTMVILLALFILSLWLSKASLSHSINSNGITLPLGGVRDIPSWSEGQITQLFNRSGDSVWAGKVLGYVHDPDRHNQYQEQRQLYLIQQQKFILEHEKLNFSLQSKQAEIKLLIEQDKTRLTFLTSLAFELSKAIEKNTKKGEKSLKDQEKNLAKLKAQYQNYLKNLDKLKSKGYASDTSLLDRLSGYESIVNSFSEIQRQGHKAQIDNKLNLNQLGDIRNHIAKTRVSILEAQNELSEFQQQVKIDREDLALEEEKIKKELIKMERNWWRNSLIIAPFDGKLLSFIPGLGQLLRKGEIASIIALSPQYNKQLLSISPNANQGRISLLIDNTQIHFDFKNAQLNQFYQKIGEKLASYFKNDVDFAIGESGLILASTEQNKLNNIRIKANRLTDSENIPVFAEINSIGDNWHQQENVNISIVSERHAKLLQNGMLVNILAKHQSRWIDASSLGEITQISDYPMTALEIENLIGSKQLATSVSNAQAGYVVISRMLANAKQTLLTMPVATRTENRFIIGRKSPIKLILPFIEDRFSAITRVNKS